MSESPTKKRKDGPGPMNGGGGDPYSRYPHHYGQPPPQAYGSHPPPPPPYGYHQPPPGHYPQSMYPPNQPPPPPNYQVSPMYPNPPPQSWNSPPPQSSQYCQAISSQPPSNQHPRSRQSDNWKNEPNMKGSRNSEADVNGSGGNRRYANGPDRRQSQSPPSDKNGDKASSPPKGGGNGAGATSSGSGGDGSRRGWNQNNWHGGSAQGQYMRGPPPPGVWNSSGSPPNWNDRGPHSGPSSGGARRSSPPSSARMPSTMRKTKSTDAGDKDKGRGSYRCGKVRLFHFMCVK